MYRALDPDFGQNRIHITDFRTSFLFSSSCMSLETLYALVLQFNQNQQIPVLQQPNNSQIPVLQPQPNTSAAPVYYQILSPQIQQQLQQQQQVTQQPQFSVIGLPGLQGLFPYGLVQKGGGQPVQFLQQNVPNTVQLSVPQFQVSYCLSIYAVVQPMAKVKGLKDSTKNVNLNFFLYGYDLKSDLNSRKYQNFYTFIFQNYNAPINYLFCYL